MDIFLSINNRERVIQIPLLPASFSVSSPQSNETFQTVAGELNMIGNIGLRSISWESRFPAKAVSYSRNNSMFGWEYVNAIEEMRTRKVPFRLIITETNINMAVTVDSFTYGLDGGSKDIRYSISLKEFVF